MKKLFFALAMLVSIPCFSLPILGEGPPFPRPPWADEELVKIRIDPDLYGSTVEQSFSFTADFTNFAYNPNASTPLPGEYANGTKVSNSGHFHVFAGKVEDDGFFSTNVFLGAPAATLIDVDTVRFNINLPENGLWQIVVDPQYDDHTPRVPRHPQVWRSFDVTRVNIVPEPSSLALLGLGGLLLTRRVRK